MQKTLPTTVFELFTSQSIATPTIQFAMSHLILQCCNRLYISNKLYFGVRAIESTQKWWTKAKSHLRTQKCSRVKAQNFQAKNLREKGQHVYNNCHELRSRASKKDRTPIPPKLFGFKRRVYMRLAEAIILYSTSHWKNIPGRLPEKSRRWFQYALLGLKAKKILKTKDFCTKTFFKCNLFWWHFVVEHKSVSQIEATGSSINTIKQHR